jgi:hypothetical protein
MMNDKLFYLCESIGLEPGAFYIDQDEEGNTVLRSDYTIFTPILPEIVDNEKECLWQARELFKDAVALLISELEMIDRHWNTYYGEDKEGVTAEL